MSFLQSASSPHASDASRQNPSLLFHRGNRGAWHFQPRPPKIIYFGPLAVGLLSSAYLLEFPFLEVPLIGPWRVKTSSERVGGPVIAPELLHDMPKLWRGNDISHIMCLIRARLGGERDAERWLGSTISRRVCAIIDKNTLLNNLPKKSLVLEKALAPGCQKIGRSAQQRD